MRRLVLIFLLVGVIALIASGIFVKIELAGPLPPDLRPAPTLSIKDIAQLILSALLVVASLFVILSKRYAPKDQNWAYGTIGTILGFWLHPGS